MNSTRRRKLEKELIFKDMISNAEKAGIISIIPASISGYAVSKLSDNKYIPFVVGGVTYLVSYLKLAKYLSKDNIALWDEINKESLAKHKKLSYHFSKTKKSRRKSRKSRKSRK